MPMPSGKNLEVCSTFDLLLGEPTWYLDLIEYALQPPEAVKLEWCPTTRRYVLRRRDGSRNAGTEIKSAETNLDKCEDVRSLGLIDRKDLHAGLENRSIFIPDTSGTIGRLVRLFCKPDKKILPDIIVKRCKVEMHSDRNPSMDIRSLSVDPECSRNDHRDLKPGKELGGGRLKMIYGGEWCGQRVAIATMRDFRFEDLKDEVKQLLGLQHPKVVSLFGWAYTDDAPAPI